MYSQYVLSLLKEIDFRECPQIEIESVLRASVGEFGQQIRVYCSQSTYYFKAIGSPYLLAMAQWLIKVLQQGKRESLRQLTMAELVAQFSLPAHKRQDALLILQLIEKLHDK